MIKFIFEEVFNFKFVVGGVVGVLMVMMIKIGVVRGLYFNEVGLGSLVIIVVSV